MNSFSSVDLKKQPQAREVFGFGLLLLIILFVFFDTLLSPRFDALQKIKLKYKTAYQQKDAVERLIAALDHQVKQQEDNKNNEIDRRQNLPRNERLKNILTYKVTDVTEETTAIISMLSGRRMLKRIKYLESKVGDQQEQKGYTLVPVALRLQGHYSALIRYIEDLEKIDRPLLLSGFKFFSPKQGRFLIADLNIKLYLPK